MVIPARASPAERPLSDWYRCPVAMVRCPVAMVISAQAQSKGSLTCPRCPVSPALSDWYPARWDSDWVVRRCSNHPGDGRLFGRTCLWTYVWPNREDDPDVRASAYPVQHAGYLDSEGVLSLKVRLGCV